MKYLLMYIWKLTFGIIGIVIVGGTIIFGMKVSKMFTDFALLQLMIAAAMWIGGSFILTKPLIVLDRYLEDKASLDKDARINLFVFITFVLISLAIFLTSIHFFKEWWELINDTVHRTTDDYYTIIFPLTLLVVSIGSFLGSFKLYKKYKDTIKRK